MGWKSILALIVTSLFVIWMLLPSYEIKVYKLGFNPYVYLTQMIYWQPFDRQLIYIYGKREEESYPKRDYIVRSDFSGFDASSVVIAVCDSNQQVIINYNDGLFDTPVRSKRISARMTEHEDWVQLDTNQIGLRIRAN